MLKKIRLRIFIIAVILTAVFAVYSITKPSVSTEMVKYGTMENTGVYNGIVIRDETLVTSEISGTLESYAEEGEVVRKNMNVAVVYKGEVDSETQAKLKQINKQIAEISGTQESLDSFTYDKYKIEGTISNRVADMIGYANTRNSEKIKDIKDEINKLIGRKHNISGGDGSAETMLNELKKEKEKYEAELSASKEELFSPCSGIYSTEIDGYETVVDKNIISSITVGEFNEIYDMDVTKEDIKSSGIACKIINNVEWYVAIKVDAKIAEGLKTGSPVYIKLSDDNEFDASVSYISDDDEKEKIIVVKSTEYHDEILSGRKIKVTLTTGKYSGLKVPMEAIRVKDGLTGVYTVTNGLMKFKKVDVLYNDGKTAIVKEDSAASGTLLLYDEVVISAKNVEEGKLIR